MLLICVFRLLSSRTVYDAIGYHRRSSIAPQRIHTMFGMLIFIHRRVINRKKTNNVNTL